MGPARKAQSLQVGKLANPVASTHSACQFAGKKDRKSSTGTFGSAGASHQTSSRKRPNVGAKELAWRRQKQYDLRTSPENAPPGRELDDPLALARELSTFAAALESKIPPINKPDVDMNEVDETHQFVERTVDVDSDVESSSSSEWVYDVFVRDATTDSTPIKTAPVPASNPDMVSLSQGLLILTEEDEEMWEWKNEKEAGLLDEDFMTDEEDENGKIFCFTTCPMPPSRF